MAITTFVSLIASSQVVTDTNRLTLSHAVAKAIAKDIVRLDSATEILKLKDEELRLLEKKINLKDSVLNYYQLKEVNYKHQIQNQNYKIEGWQEQYSILQKDYRKLEVKHKFTKVLFYAILGGVGYLYITK